MWRGLDLLAPGQEQIRCHLHSLFSPPSPYPPRAIRVPHSSACPLPNQPPHHPTAESDSVSENPLVSFSSLFFPLACFLLVSCSFISITGPPPLRPFLRRSYACNPRALVQGNESDARANAVVAVQAAKLWERAPIQNGKVLRNVRNGRTHRRGTSRSHVYEGRGCMHAWAACVMVSMEALNPDTRIAPSPSLPLSIPPSHENRETSPTAGSPSAPTRATRRSSRARASAWSSWSRRRRPSSSRNATPCASARV